jgi:hypothetical protein
MNHALACGCVLAILVATLPIPSPVWGQTANAPAPGTAPAPESAPAAPASPAPDEPHWLPPSTRAVLQGLDKITGHVRTIEATIDKPVRFGTLDILVRTCRKRPPEEQPESAAYLQITETKPGEPAKSLFSGWMFASSPAVSALEDPVYDVWVIDCKGA